MATAAGGFSAAGPLQSASPSERIGALDLKVVPRSHVASAEEQVEIAGLIAALAPSGSGSAVQRLVRDQNVDMVFHVRRPDPATDASAGMISRYPGDFRLLDSAPAWRLVELGPKAMPALLAALEDATKVGDPQGIGGSHIVHEDDFRPLPLSGVSERERRLIDAALPSRGPERDGFFNPTLPLCRADLCMAVLGEIVNRHYPCWDHRWGLTKSASPVHNAEVARVVRAIWSGDDSAQVLFDSLIDDVRRGDPSDRGALARLAYYFPDETAPLFAGLIEATPTIGGWKPWLDDSLVQVLGRSPSPEVLSALLRRLATEKSHEAIAALIGPAVSEANPELVLAKSKHSAMGAAQIVQDWHSVELDRTLGRVLRWLPTDARSVFDLLAAQESSNLRRVVLGLLMLSDPPPPWLVEVVTPLLDDDTECSSWSTAHGTGHPLRVCDLAAMVLARHVDGLIFDESATGEDRDRQLATMCTAMDLLAVGTASRNEDGERIEPAAVVSLIDPGAWVWISPASDADRLIAVTAYNCGDEPPRIFEIDLRNGSRRDVPIRLGPGVSANLLSGVDTPKGTIAVVAENGLYRIDLVDGSAALLTKLPPFNEDVFEQSADRLGLGDVVLTSNIRSEILSTRIVDGVTSLVHKPADGSGRSFGRMCRLTDPDRAIVSDWPSDDERPDRVIGPDGAVVETLDGLPRGGWLGGSGPFLCNNMNSRLVIWSTQTRAPVVLPLAHGVIAQAFLSAGGEGMGTLAFVPLSDGDVAVVDLSANRRVGTLTGAASRSAGGLTLSDDRRMLFLAQGETGAGGRGFPAIMHVTAWDVGRWTGGR